MEVEFNADPQVKHSWFWGDYLCPWDSTSNFSKNTEIV